MAINSSLARSDSASTWSSNSPTLCRCRFASFAFPKPLHFVDVARSRSSYTFLSQYRRERGEVDNRRRDAMTEPYGASDPFGRGEADAPPVAPDLRKAVNLSDPSDREPRVNERGGAEL